MKAYGICETTFLWGCCVLGHAWITESLDRRSKAAFPVTEHQDISRQFSGLWGGPRTPPGAERSELVVDQDHKKRWRPKKSDYVDEWIGGESKDGAQWVDETITGSLRPQNYHEYEKLDRTLQDKRGAGEGQEWYRRLTRRRKKRDKISKKVVKRVRERAGQKRNKRALDSGTVSTERPSNKTIFSGVSREKERQLNEIARKDMIAALLEFVEVAEAGLNTSPTWATRNCTLRLNQDVLSLLTPKEIFRDQTIKAIQTANTLNNVFWNPLEVPLHDRFFFALIEGLVQSDPLIYGAAIAFDPGQLPNPQRPLSPYVHRGQASGYLQVRNVTRESRGRYAVNGTEGYEWFWKQRKDFSPLLWDHRDVCAKFKVGDEALSVADIPTAVSSVDEGLWGNFQFDCPAVRVWTISYSVPFFGCAQKQLVFKYVCLFISLTRVFIGLTCFIFISFIY